ncbi:MAG TPA: universal stress protein [Candidatus Thermoplasmatota archaeon]|nr:universal stress protein [Candidatus Thermoplasmatota archaeon]
MRVRVAPQEAQPLQRVVVGLEGSDADLFVGEQAAVFAAALAVPLLALHVQHPTQPTPKGLFADLEKRCGRRGVPFMGRILTGTDVAAEILAELTPADLCILGTRRLLKGFRTGSVARRVLESAPGPVQLIRVG